MKIQQQKLKKIAQKYKLNYLVLFGSRANNTARPNSDFDIAYSSRQNIDYKEEVFLAEELSRALNIKAKKIDLVNTKNASPLLAKEIADNGILLAEFTPNSFDNFQIYAFMIYVEAKPLFKMQEEFLKRNISKK